MTLYVTIDQFDALHSLRNECESSGIWNEDKWIRGVSKILNLPIEQLIGKEIEIKVNYEQPIHHD